MRITDHPQAEAYIVDTLLTAPGWARAGITAPSEPLREAAARELARAILDDGGTCLSPNQLQLFP